ncbi:DUF3302 domain-containing protein [Flavobacterium sp. LPB0248]|uniref:DUF3302 domain-containing protein n=1 Tax=Flavobacterium sp. LPB0248 TaxID=2614441 RepID=UPI0015A5BEE1|nr:DUF3302 domain-containing protein [Flavobacterium sp. LPB0248]QLC64760.1 DUF3302 domain-containing protein [Flavobacterium sp. LPB0248]
MKKNATNLKYCTICPYLGIVLFLLLIPQSANAHASGEALDSIAEAVSWVVLIIAPIIGITVFLMVHILPEKIAEKRKHPQAEAIKTLCLLSLAFGGLLWPLAWLWAYSKPVFYKMAYKTDQGDYHEPTMKDLAEEKAAEREKEDLE